MKNIPQHTLTFLHSWLELRTKTADTPGFSVAIAKNDKLIFKHAYGVRDMGTKEALEPDMIFRIASHSKTFTATAIMQLQEKGALRIDDLVITYLPWLKDHKDARWQHVSLRELLSHSAGVIRDGTDAAFWQLLSPFPDEVEFRQMILDADLVIEPNTKLKYSNFGFTLLGLVIKEVSGISYNEYVMENIVEPLGLKNTFPEFTKNIEAKMVAGHTRLYTNRERHVLPHASTNILSAATGFCSTAEDLCMYFSAQRVGSGKLLTDESKREMQRTHWKAERSANDYGLGMQINHIGNRTTYGHSGGFPGHITNSVLDPEDGLVVVVLTNSHDGEAGLATKAILTAIDTLGESEPDNNLLRFEGRFAGLGSFEEIIVKNSRLLAISPKTWFPFENAEVFKKINDTRLKIIKASSYSSEGEFVDYVFNEDNSVQYIMDSGIKLMPSNDGDYFPL